MACSPTECASQSQTFRLGGPRVESENIKYQVSLCSQKRVMVKKYPQIFVSQTSPIILCFEKCLLAKNHSFPYDLYSVHHFLLTHIDLEVTPVYL